MSLQDTIRKLSGPVLAGGALLTVLSGWPVHFVRDNYIGTVENKTYVVTGKPSSSQARIDVKVKRDKKMRLVLEDSILEGKLDAAREYQQITIGETYCFKTYGLKKATTENYAPSLYGLHIVNVEPQEKCK